MEVVNLTDTVADIETCAGWLNERWGRDMGYSLAGTVKWLQEITQPGGSKVALIAKQSGLPVGICMLVDCDLDSREDLTPWLAALFVLPAYRLRSIGSQLVDEVESLARQSDADAIHLYTFTAEPFYARLGWVTTERFCLGPNEFALMQKCLS